MPEVNVSIASGMPAIPATGEGDSIGSRIWHRGEVREWMERTIRGECMHLVAKQKRREFRLGFVRRRILPGLVLASTFPYARILGARELLATAVPAIRQALARHGIGALEVALTGEELAWFMKHNPELVSLPANYAPVRHVVDLRQFGGEDEYLASLDSRIRWSIRKSGRMGVRVRPAEPGEISGLQSLYHQTMKEKGAPTLYGPERFGLILQQLRPARLGDIHVAVANGRSIGMAAVVRDEHSSHLIQVAAPQEFRSFRASDALVFHALAESLRRGERFFDFMATSPGDTGVAGYKRKWLAMEEPLRYVVITAHPMRMRAIQALRWLRRRF